jgi:hypothetical protein
MTDTDRAAVSESAAALARQLWRALEPVHAVTYFSPETRQATDALGMRGGWMSYFACRSAPLGAASAELVTATFYNFHPTMVARAIPDAWSYAAPEKVLDARLAAVDAALHRILGPLVESDEVAEAAALARRAAELASTAGRPLAAANAALPWPAEPHLALWTATTRLREHRGDGHVAALVYAGIDPCQAHVTLAAAGGPPKEMLLFSRKWSEQEWAAAEHRLVERGLLDEHGAMTPAGVALRESVERRTDELAAEPWSALGTAEAGRLAELVRPLSRQIIATGALPIPNPMGLDWSEGVTD